MEAYDLLKEYDIDDVSHYNNIRHSNEIMGKDCYNVSESLRRLTACETGDIEIIKHVLGLE